MTHLRLWRSALCSLFIALLASTTAWAGHRKLSPELNDKLASLEANSPVQTAADPLVEVIIQFRPGAKLADGIQKVLDAGGAHKSHLDIINGGLFHVPASQLSTLANDPDVAYISSDRQTIKLSPYDYILDATNTNVVLQTGWSGRGVGVAVIDSGVNATHPDLGTDTRLPGSRVVFSQSLVPGLDASDQYGHGTAVAGLLAGNGEVSEGWMRGIAPKANIINLRVLDANGSGTDSAVIAAIERAIQLKRSYNIRIINLSLGRGVLESYKLDPLCQAVEQAWKAGIVVVVAAGNYGRFEETEGYGTITVPGNDPYVITVGAMNTHGTDTVSDDTIASYSSKGPTLLDHVIKPDLVAPGNRIVTPLDGGSNLDTKYPGNHVSPAAYGSRSSQADYSIMSGTSFAAPIVSGAAALMLEEHPGLTPDQVKARLMKTANKVHPLYSTAKANDGNQYTSQYDIFTFGAGYLNTYAALASNDFPKRTALSPIAVRDSSGNVLLQADPSSLWGSSILWGDSIVWGDSAFLNGSSLIWGDSVVWGNSTLDGYSLIWGDSIIWGDTTSLPFSEAGDYDKN